MNTKLTKQELYRQYRVYLANCKLTGERRASFKQYVMEVA